MYIYVGKIIGTHGINGEIKVKASFKYKEDEFKNNQYIYIGEAKEKLQILNQRIHQNNYLLTLENINDINIAIPYKQKKVYIIGQKNKIYDENLIDMEVYYQQKQIGLVTDILKGKQNIIVINNKHMIPYVDHFIKKVDKNNNTIELQNIEGLIHEN